MHFLRWDLLYSSVQDTETLSAERRMGRFEETGPVSPSVSVYHTIVCWVPHSDGTPQSDTFSFSLLTDSIATKLNI